MPGTPGKSGGARAGAGRLPKAEKFARPIATAEKRIADRLPELVENLFALAEGGYQRDTRRYEPAGMVYRDDYLKNDDGRLIYDMQGKPIKIRVLAFPNLPPEQLVLVEHRTETADRDRTANIYLIDRILGKPVTAVEAQVTGDLRSPVLEAFGAAVLKIYGEKETTAGDGDATEQGG